MPEFDQVIRRRKETARRIREPFPLIQRFFAPNLDEFLRFLVPTVCRDAVLQLLFGRPKRRVLHFERIENPLLEELMIRHPGYPFDDRCRQHVTDTGIDMLRVRMGFQGRHRPGQKQVVRWDGIGRVKRRRLGKAACMTQEMN